MRLAIGAADGAMWSSIRNVFVRSRQPANRSLKRTTKSASTRHFSSTLPQHFQMNKHSSRAKTKDSLVTAYCVAIRYNLESVNKIIAASSKQVELPTELNDPENTQVVHLELQFDKGRQPCEDGWEPNTTGDVFIFPSGTIVSWGVPRADIIHLTTNVLSSAATSPLGKYGKDVCMEWEENSLHYGSFVSHRTRTIVFGTRDVHSKCKYAKQPSKDAKIAKIAYSFGLARAARTATVKAVVPSSSQASEVVESMLDKGFMNDLTSRNFVYERLHSLLGLRTFLNAYSKLIDGSIDKESGLEEYYKEIEEVFEVSHQVKLLNKDLDYAQQLCGNLRDVHSAMRDSRLEKLRLAVLLLCTGGISYLVYTRWSRTWPKEHYYA